MSVVRLVRGWDGKLLREDAQKIEGIILAASGVVVTGTKRKWVSDWENIGSQRVVARRHGGVGGGE